MMNLLFCIKVGVSTLFARIPMFQENGKISVFNNNVNHLSYTYSARCILKGSKTVVYLRQVYFQGFVDSISTGV